MTKRRLVYKLVVSGFEGVGYYKSISDALDSQEAIEAADRGLHVDIRAIERTGEITELKVQK